MGRQSRVSRAKKWFFDLCAAITRKWCKIRPKLRLSIDTKIEDLGWPWTAVRSNFLGISRDFACLRGNNSWNSWTTHSICFKLLHKHDKLTQCCRAFTLALARLSCWLCCRVSWSRKSNSSSRHPNNIPEIIAGSVDNAAHMVELFAALVQNDKLHMQAYWEWDTSCRIAVNHISHAFTVLLLPIS